MASTTKKVRKLDAICAKLKSVTNEEPSKTSTPENESVCDKESENLDSTAKHLTNGELNNECSSDLNLQNAEEKAENLKNDESFVSRRKKRKASTPRNIAQVREVLENFEDFDEKDELAEYEINNQNTTFPPEEDGDDESEHAQSPKDDLEKCNGIPNGVSDSAVITNHNPIANISSLHSGSKKHSRKARKPQNVVGIPLDLSISKTSTDNDSVNGESFEENFCPQNEDSNGFPDTPEDLSIASENCNTGESKSVSPTDKNDSSEISISALKDYAENTMNELLQMYGLSGSEDSSIGQVSQKKLLQTVQSLSFKGDKSNLINSLIKNPAHLNGTVDLGLSTPLMSHLPSSVIKKGIYANFVSTSANKLKPQISSDGQPRITISQGCITSTGVPSNAPILLKPTPVGAGVKIKDELKNNTDFIRSVLHQQKQNNLVSGATKQLSPDYSTYLKRFNNGQECGVKYCKELSYREHFHCMDCNFRVFIKKEEMVRHYKWHRKREESLQHGFMRYSPMDDCSQKFNNCTHNGRQTHYHCLQDGCDKVYISTSDVQMHANYHRKDSAIIQEGFQRFRATEDCGTLTCAFYGQRTTHFHCRRNSCNFTFKNKADMEKHKTYHQKDEVLGRDGFKKFMKYEHCGYYGCRYSKVSNHIHCIRKGCNYVLHSTAQLYSHKRKHERRDFEAAYRKYREDGNSKDGPEGVSMATQVQLSDSNSTSLSIKKEPLDDSEMGDDFDMDDSLDSSSHMADSEGIKMEGDFEDNSSDIMSSAVSEASDCNVGNLSTLSSCTEDSVKFPEKESKAFNISDHMPNMSGDKLDGSLTLPIPNYNSPSTNQTIIKKEATSPQEATPALAQPKLPVFVPTSVLPQHTVTAIPLPARPPERILERREKDESWKNYLIRYTANDPCNSRCQYLYKDHYHCKVEGCLVLFKSKDGVREHARFHELQDRITPVAYETYEVDESCPQECQYNMKERHYHCIWSGCSHVVPHAGPTFGRLEHYRIHEFARTSAGKSYKSSPKLDDSNCPRRRGRPPKYPKNEIPVIPKIELSEEEIQESRKVAVNETENAKIINGFRTFAENELCPDELCIYRSKHHFHCARPRCHHATDRMDVLNLHAKDFHSFVTILDGFEFFDRNINCRRSHCHNNKANRHFHCIKPKCDYSFVRHSTMIQHDKKHKLCNSEKVQSVPLKKDFPVSLAQTFIPIVPALQTGTTSVIQAVPGTPLVKVSLPSHKLPATPGSESSVSSAVVSSSPVLHTVTNLSPADTPKSAQPGTVIVSPMCATAAAQAVSTGPITPSSAPGSAPASIPGTVLASSTSSPVTASNGQVQTIPKVEPSNAVVTSVIMSGANVLSLASVDSNNKPIVKTAGTFYPLSGLAKAEGMTLSSVGALSLPNSSLAIAVNPMQTVALSTLPLISPPCGTTVAPLASPLISTAVNQLPLTVLLQQKGNNAIPSPDWTVLRDKMHYSVDQNCGRPFCKLKKKDHFHCFECNQAFSDPARIKIHMGKHGLKFNKLEIHETYQPITIAPKPAGSVVNTEYKNSMSDRQAANSSSTADVALSDVDSDDNDEKSSSLNLNPSAFSNMIAKAQKENAAKTSFNLSDDYFSKSFSDTDNDSISGKLVIADIDNNGVSNPAEDDSLDTSMFSGNMDEAGNSSVSKWSGRKRTAPKNDDFVDSNTVVVKQRKTSNTSSNSPRTAKDDSIPDGYIRYRFKEDCKYPKCAYRQGVTHFHCARSDCGYSFSDRSRLIQHTLRHERIDSLTGGEMQQFRINQDCSRTGCEFVGKASHFHCLKCDYSCTDSSKVLTHRKHHAKMESINQQGFHKYSVSEDCGIEGCHYSSKQTHYHCLKSGCNYAVTGPAQMSSHKMKHANDS